MSTDEMDEKVLSTKVLTVLGLSVSFVAALLQQIGHEATHAVTALALGKNLEFYHLFAVGSSWSALPHATADVLIAGCAAVFNIFCGAVCVALFDRPGTIRRPVWRLFLLYFGALSIFSGFGYLMFDAILYDPAGDNAGDWRKVIEFLGGDWYVRVPILLIGAAGSLFGFFWLPYSAVRLGDANIDKPGRTRLALSLELSQLKASKMAR